MTPRRLAGVFFVSPAPRVPSQDVPVRRLPLTRFTVTDRRDREAADKVVDLSGYSLNVFNQEDCAWPSLCAIRPATTVTRAKTGTCKGRKGYRMKLSDSRMIKADIETVWSALLNADVLKECVPGCQEMEGSPEQGFEAVVVQKVGPVKATFKGKVDLENMQAPSSLTISGAGKGGAAGFAKGAADVRLEAADEGTILHYDVEAKVGGKLAQLGSRIIDGFAKKMADEFFTRFQNALEEPEDSEEQTGTQDMTAKKGWFKRLVT
jgi:carbon monoxide dehydrogenase subunit G